ncbi:hypothetical protein BJF78_17525 [Pseudonocardia sp. CNS-139]|nr:hypothetical protein BJF78_17525 [Pseudonocardia sp. CNS-139]
MIMMRSPRRAASSTSWVTNTTVVRCARQICSSSSCIRARVSASSAPNGSSISSTGGRRQNARAIATRCFCPPESVCGYWWACARSPTMSM